jgi:hypothetical protein
MNESMMNEININTITLYVVTFDSIMYWILKNRIISRDKQISVTIDTRKLTVIAKRSLKISVFLNQGLLIFYTLFPKPS